MAKIHLSLLLLLFSFNSYSLTAKETFTEVKNDSVKIHKNQVLEEHFRTNVVLMKNGIYEGYLPYVHELIRSDFSKSGKYLEHIGRKSPKGYMFFINTNDWSKYLDKNEPSFSDNLKKYVSLSESSRELYRNKYLTRLEELQTRDMEKGVYSFERAVIVSYLKALGAGNFSGIPNNHYMGGKYDAGIDEEPVLEVKLGDEVRFSIRMQDWSYYLGKYHLLEDIKKAWKLNGGDFELIIDYNENLSNELQELERYQELISWKKGVESGEIFLNIEQYEAFLKDMQRNSPGNFQNKQRIENQRNKELEKLEYYKNFEYEHCIAEENNLFPEDLAFKIKRIEILQYFVSTESIYPDELWFLNYPDYTLNAKEIAYKFEINYERPEALYFGERPKL